MSLYEKEPMTSFCEVISWTLRLVLLHCYREHNVSQWLIMTLTMWKLILLQCLEFPSPLFSSPFTSHSSTGLAVYSPLAHWKHHYNLPWCKFVLRKNALATAWRGIFQALLTSPQAWLPAWLGAHTEMKIEHNIVWETIKLTLHFQGVQLEKEPFLCGSLRTSWVPCGSKLQISSQILDSRRKNQIILFYLFASFHSVHSMSSQKRMSLLSSLHFFWMEMRAKLFVPQCGDEGNTNS